MFQGLLSAIVDVLLAAAWRAIVKFLGLADVVEIATAIIGLGFIVIGLAAFWLGQ